MHTSLPRPWHKLLLTSHIGASVGALGADLSVIVLVATAQAGGGGEALYAAAHLIAGTLLAPLALLSLLSGLLLGLTSGWGLFRYWWVTVKLGIVVVLSGAVLFVLEPALAQMAASPATAARPTLLAAPLVGTMLLLLAAGLGVFKPGWRLRRDASPPPSTAGISPLGQGTNQ